MSILGRLCACLALFMLPLAGCSGGMGSLADLSTPANAPYHLSGGDELRVYVYGLEPLTNTFTLDERGTLSLPLIEPIHAEGMTLAQLETAIAEQLREDKLLNDPRVNVQSVKLRPIYVLGEVRTPGEYPYRPGLTVLSAVTLAGGFTYRANEDEVAIIRTQNGKTIKGRADPMAAVQPGDTIRVNERWF